MAIYLFIQFLCGNFRGLFFFFAFVPLPTKRGFRTSSTSHPYPTPLSFSHRRIRLGFEISNDSNDGTGSLVRWSYTSLLDNWVQLYSVIHSSEASLKGSILWIGAFDSLFSTSSVIWSLKDPSSQGKTAGGFGFPPLSYLPF